MSADISVATNPESAVETASFLHRWMTPITASVVLLTLTTAVLWVAEAHLQQDHLIFIYFVPTALIAIRYGSLTAMGVAIAGGIAAAFLLYPPRFSLLVENPLDLMELVLFSLLALLASQVVSGFASDSGVARRRARAPHPRRLFPLRNRIRDRRG